MFEFKMQIPYDGEQYLALILYINIMGIKLEGMLLIKRMRIFTYLTSSYLNPEQEED